MRYVVALVLVVVAALVGLLLFEANKPMPRGGAILVNTDEKVKRASEFATSVPRGELESPDQTDEGADLDFSLKSIEPPDFPVVVLPPIKESGRTWAETYQRLKSRVENGDSDAQYELAIAARRCWHTPRTEDQLDRLLDSAGAPYYDASGSYVSDVEQGTARRELVQEAYDYCRDSAIDVLAKFPDWLEQSAQSGNPRAMLAWGAGYPGDDEIDYSSDDGKTTAEARRQQYLSYLEQARDLGSIDAAARLAGMMLETDPIEKRKEIYSNLYAYAWYRWRLEGDDGSFKYLKRIGDAMGPSDFEEAVSQGKQLLESDRCCFKIPEIS